MDPNEQVLDLSSSVRQFWTAPDEALFPQTALVAITGLSNAYFERSRWEGGGPKFLKIGRLVRYRKSDVLAWINQRPTVSSTSEVKSAHRPGPGRRRKPAVDETAAA